MKNQHRKNQRRPLRLGSFELLEARALLAHAGMPHGMFHEGGEQRPLAEFQRPPSMESRTFGSFASRPGGDFNGFDHGPRGQRTFEALPAMSTNYSSSPSVPAIYNPPPQVIVIITLPPLTITSPQFAEPLTSSLKDPPPRQTQNTSFANPPASNLQASPTPSHSSSNTAPLDSLSVLSGLSLKRSITESASDESEDANPATDVRDGQTTSEEQDASALQPTVESVQKLQPTTTDTVESDLIELDPEELLKRAKRKSPRAVTSPQIETKLRDSVALREHTASRVPERHSDIWLSPADVDAVLAPVDDDLIELLATDQVEMAKPIIGRSQPFAAAGASIQLEANFGYYQAIETPEAETDPAAISVAQPADVATALRARATE